MYQASYNLSCTNLIIVTFIFEETVLINSVDDSMPYSDACSELKHMYESNSADVPKILRLLRLTFEDRRKFINGLKNAEINQILKEFPHLQDIRFVSNSYVFLFYHVCLFHASSRPKLLQTG